MKILQLLKHTDPIELRSYVILDQSSTRITIDTTTNPQSQEKTKNNLRFRERDRETFLWRALSSFETLAFSFMVGMGESDEEEKRKELKMEKESAGDEEVKTVFLLFSTLSLSLFLYGVKCFWTVLILGLVYRFGLIFP